MSTTRGETAGRRDRVRWTVTDGRAVVAKTASGRERPAIRYEAEVLGRLQLPGLIHLIGVVEEDDLTTMLSADAGRRSLARPVDLSSDELLRALRRCVVAVGEMHAAGWTHGALRAEHVLIGSRCSVRLCSLSSARPIDDRAMTPRTMPDDSTSAAPRGSNESISIDLGHLLDIIEHVAELPIGASTRMEQRRRRRDAVRLRRLARDLRHRPLSDTSELTAALESVGPNRSASPGRGRPISMRTSMVATCVLAVTFLGWALLSANHGSVAASAASASFAASASADPAHVVSNAPATALDADTAPGGSRCRWWIRPGRDIDGDSCPDQVTVNGNEVTVDATTYRLGGVDDIVAVGDRDCDGTAHAMLLRPATGELFEFPEWARSSAPSAGHVVATIDRGRSLRSEPISGSSVRSTRSCDRFVVTLDDGTDMDPFDDKAEKTP